MVINHLTWMLRGLARVVSRVSMVGGDWVYSHSLTNRANHRVGLVTCFGCTPLINGFIHLNAGCFSKP